MNLRIIQIADPGVPNSERIHLSVLADTSLEFYVLLKSFSTTTGVANGAAPAFWFPTVNVKRGDQIVVYTKPGTNSSAPLLGHTNHFFFWGMKQTLFNMPNDCALLIEASDWESLKRPKADSSSR